MINYLEIGYYATKIHKKIYFYEFINVITFFY
jgi:hypothetical protein